MRVGGSCESSCRLLVEFVIDVVVVFVASLSSASVFVLRMSMASGLESMNCKKIARELFKISSLFIRKL